ncbi:MAG: LamG domain-containing protein, partial [Planctomycetota bacterium]
IMTEHWGEDYSLCDIGPTPFGDGIVDVQDLVALTEYIEPIDRTLIAYWALDETEGMFAEDGAGDNDAFIIGDPLWLPSNGQVDGALQFDGVDDVVIAGAVLNPADGPFSVFAWVNVGAPGQAVISQQGVANWLSTDLLEGCLMTEVKGPGRSAGPLLSETTITDGNWHHIGFVWDCTHRTLYVDGVVVAQDRQDSLVSSSNGLYIGTGKAMEPGTYFSGLIDDVRVYDVALTAEDIAVFVQ